MVVGDAGHLLILQSIENIRSNSHPDQQEHPDAPAGEVVIGQQLRPGVSAREVKNRNSKATVRASQKMPISKAPLPERDGQRRTNIQMTAPSRIIPVNVETWWARNSDSFFP